MIRSIEGAAFVASTILFGACSSSTLPVDVHASDLDPGSPYAITVTSVELGEGGGFGSDQMPDIVLGAPNGEGDLKGSTDVLSLGRGGSIVLELGVDVIDGEGADLIVFENAFYVAGTRSAYAEPGAVAVSEDGETFVEWTCDASSTERTGCAGVHPVYANANESVGDALDPEVSGGDAFDLADIGVTRAHFIRIRDMGNGHETGSNTDGFDLDAISIVHADDSAM